MICPLCSSNLYEESKGQWKDWLCCPNCSYKIKVNNNWGGTMEQFKNIQQGIIYDKDILCHVVSEPGDATRYDFFIYYDSYEYFSCMPCKSSFRFPEKFSRHHIENISDEDIVKMAQDYFCNPHTLKECIRIATIILLTKGW